MDIRSTLAAQAYAATRPATAPKPGSRAGPAEPSPAPRKFRADPGRGRGRRPRRR